MTDTPAIPKACMNTHDNCIAQTHTREGRGRDHTSRHKGEPSQHFVFGGHTRNKSPIANLGSPPPELKWNPVKKSTRGCVVLYLVKRQPEGAKCDL